MKGNLYLIRLFLQTIIEVMLIPFFIIGVILIMTRSAIFGLGLIGLVSYIYIYVDKEIKK